MHVLRLDFVMRSCPSACAMSAGTWLQRPPHSWYLIVPWHSEQRLAGHTRRVAELHLRTQTGCSTQHSAKIKGGGDAHGAAPRHSALHRALHQIVVTTRTRLESQHYGSSLCVSGFMSPLSQAVVKSTLQQTRMAP